MKIKITENAGSLFVGHVNCGNETYSEERRQTLLKIQGKIIEVETEHLFGDQFNTVPIYSISEKGIRIHARYVEEVIDDARPGKGRCQNCGHIGSDFELCEECGKFDTVLPFVLLPEQTVVCWANRDKALAVLEEAPCIVCGAPEPDHDEGCTAGKDLFHGIDLASGKDKTIEAEAKPDDDGVLHLTGKMREIDLNACEYCDDPDCGGHTSMLPGQ